MGHFKGFFRGPGLFWPLNFPERSEGQFRETFSVLELIFLTSERQAETVIVPEPIFLTSESQAEASSVP
jgi:hypothetical protein